MCTALGQPRLLGKMAHALCARVTKRLENPQTFLPKSHVGLVLQRVAELSPEFSSSAYLTDTQLSRLKRVPADFHMGKELMGTGIEACREHMADIKQKIANKIGQP
jgi:3-methyladenine DNA glycosylase/8-oxoguanine DNA glycosylase